MSRQVTIAAWGGGVNSTAMIVEWLSRNNALDFVLFADTGGEKPTTYAYLETFAEWLAKRNVPMIRVKATAQDETLEQECLRIRRLPSLAYGFKKCSLKWKRQPQDKWVNNCHAAREAWAKGEKVLKLIGYDAGEVRRATPKNGKASFDDDKYIPIPVDRVGHGSRCVHRGAAFSRHGCATEKLVLLLPCIDGRRDPRFTGEAPRPDGSGAGDGGERRQHERAGAGPQVCVANGRHAGSGATEAVASRRGRSVRLL